jgi:hypothetical protein
MFIEQCDITGMDTFFNSHFLFFKKIFKNLTRKRG